MSSVADVSAVVGIADTRAAVGPTAVNAPAAAKSTETGVNHERERR